MKLILTFLAFVGIQAFAATPFQRDPVVCQYEGVHGKVCYHAALQDAHDENTTKKERILIHLAKIELLMHRNRLPTLRPLPTAMSGNAAVPQAEIEVALGEDMSTRIQ